MVVDGRGKEEISAGCTYKNEQSRKQTPDERDVKIRATRCGNA